MDEASVMELGPAPPLQRLWRSDEALTMAIASGSSIYGITQAGSAAAITLATGVVRWRTTAPYLPLRLGVAGNTLYAYQPGAGLVRIVDNGGGFAEATLYEIKTLDATSRVSQPVPLGTTVHLVVGDRLLAVNATGGGLRFAADLNGDGPHSLYAIENDLLVVSGAGRPSRWRVGASGYSTVWDAGSPGPVALEERAAHVEAGRIFTSDQDGLRVYDAASGSLLFEVDGAGGKAFAVKNDTLYCAGNLAAVTAVSLADGSVLWQRQHLAFVNGTARVGLAVSAEHLWVGAMLDDGYEPAALWALDAATGYFAWQATGANLFYGNGLPLVIGGKLYTYGGPEPLTALGALGSSPGVLQEHITQTPNPLRGAMAGFNPLEIFILLGVPAKISFIAWHERDERNNVIGPINYQPGRHTIYYNGQWPRGWTDINQFGRLTFDIEETVSGLKYSQVLLVPVNTMPDIQQHWGKKSIEVMLYHKYVGGYPDLNFRPDALINRGESSAIIARTLGLEKPSAAFRTKFTDIASHWARNWIMALEEKGIVGGFQEADGTYTFRPDVQMTRAQQARLLVQAYAIGAAPPNFQSRFVDIAGHWAQAEIKALEAKGYVAGYREENGTYTYRPEQNLNRAEMCTLVVRIRNLTR